MSENFFNFDITSKLCWMDKLPWRKVVAKNLRVEGEGD